MSVLGSLRVGVVGLFCAASLVLVGPAPANALQDCGNTTCVFDRNGDLVPVNDDGSFEMNPGSGDDVMGPFIAIFVVMVFVGIGIAIWKVTTARELARQAGMDPDVATGMTLLDDNGLSATYLASSLRTSPAAAPVSTPAPQPAADRLAELKGLLDGGLITQVEYDQRRQAIIDSV